MTQETHIADLLAPMVEDMGYELVRVRMTGGAQDKTLQIMIDHQDESKAITVEDCETVSNAVSAVLDVEDPIEGHYSLEVSSPGIDRPLTRLKDFARFAGLETKLELHTAVEGRKNYRGILNGVDGEDILMTVDQKEYRLPFAYLNRAKLVMTDALLKKAAGE